MNLIEESKLKLQNKGFVIKEYDLFFEEQFVVLGRFITMLGKDSPIISTLRNEDQPVDDYKWL